MIIADKSDAIAKTIDNLAALTKLKLEQVQHEPLLGGYKVDAVVYADPYTFAIVWQPSGNTAQILQAVEQLKRYITGNKDSVVPLLTVPFMGETGKKLCAEVGISWLDLSGNADISAWNLRILIDGQPNRFKRRGRPSSAFAPKSSRIARWLLMNHPFAYTQRELSEATGLGEGYTSKIVNRLERDGLIVRGNGGVVTPRDARMLFEAWREQYEFEKHNILRGHIAERGGKQLLNRIHDALQNWEIDYAATGLAAAWQYDHYSDFRLVTVYLHKSPSEYLLDDLMFREETGGANVWLVVPNDEGVFFGSRNQFGISCVHPIQTFLDLDAHPERAKEAAERIRYSLGFLET